MNDEQRIEHRRLVALGQQHLIDAERLDTLAAAYRTKPAPVASVADMTEDWMLNTLPPHVLRHAAEQHRAEARRIYDRLDQEKPS